MTQNFPGLDAESFTVTRDALHAYAGILGSWTSNCRARRKHWWHASLRPSLTGLSTGVIYAEELSFDMELDLRQSVLSVRTASGEQMIEHLNGQSPHKLAMQVREFLVTAGLSSRLADKVGLAKQINRDTVFSDYSSEDVGKIAGALNAVNSSMMEFRAGIREETSPIGFWPHHFDLAMLWLPGDKVPDQDVANEEYSDKQMNFGFTFGDKGIDEPYFYVTVYTLPDGFPTYKLPAGTHWQTEGFTGAVITYRRLLEEADPGDYLIRLWSGLLADGQRLLVNPPNHES